MADVEPARPALGPLRTAELIRDRAVAAVLGQSGLNHPALVAEVRRRFGGTDVAAGALVREPLIEGAAPFVSSGRTFADCRGAPLHPEVVDAIGAVSAGDYRFAPDAQPYRHQLEAWEHLTHAERRSVLVSSGTGSGKTECFLMPLLSDLATESEAGGKLSGVRAIALYPLNALIASQEERLTAWTRPFDNRIRFGLYNGMTPEKLRAGDRGSPEQVRDRATLRADPPPILVTNVTMLEYLTVRRVDRPLIENSRGKLRWIILDEAHGYVGSAAAEIALLIRRVLLTFGVRAEDVRFVATSATIGGSGGSGDARDVTGELRRFLRDLSGAGEDRVKVVVGSRETLDLPPPATMAALTPAALLDRETVRANPAVQRFLRAAEDRPLRLDEAEAMLAPTGEPVEAVIGAVARNDGPQRPPLLPIRVHGFLRAVPGLWSCLDPDCGGAAPGWPFGAIAPARVDRCPHPGCGAPVFEVKTCRECGEPYLECEERDGHLRAVATPSTVDEFAALPERDGSDRDGDEDEGEGEGDGEPSDDQYDALTMAIAARPMPNWPNAPVETRTGRRPDRGDERTRPLPLRAADGCGACGAKTGSTGPVLRPMRFGAPFLIGNAAPVLLEGLPAGGGGKAAYRPPAEGRQLLSFTDSRQGTARFAANLQTNAERGYVRGYLFHAVQGSMAAGGEDDPEVVALRAEIKQLEQVGAPALAAMIGSKKAALAAKLAPSDKGIAWLDLRAGLAAQPEVMHWMLKVWGPRETERYAKSAETFAGFLLLREFNRRPRRGNTAETMGLARLRFDAIDRVTTVPEPLRAEGKSAADWQALLYSIIDMTVRGNFAIRASKDDIHWLHTAKPISTLLSPGDTSPYSTEISWPMVGRGKGLPSNLILILEKALRLDRTEPRDRAALNEVLDAAWSQLESLFRSNTEPGYALDFAKARIAPVTDAWLCPVSRRVLPTTALGLTPYGHREGLMTAAQPPRPIAFPRLPVTFPRGEAVEFLRDWTAADEGVRALRDVGVWTNLHDRVATLSPYLRAAEHSAQQPPARLRRFEREFKDGEINILNCSTTMEMGVDIGSVSAVMMTNVPPALANYRQRVGRAGRRRQGFASSLTYTRDNPLDREAFRDPQAYLGRVTRAPRVKLDSRRIVQRHVNALLLARWFASAGGEAMKTRAGDFFGLPEALDAEPIADAPAVICARWLAAFDTAQAMAGEVRALTRGTVLDGDRTVFDAAREALEQAGRGLHDEWVAIQQQSEGAPAEGKAGLAYQLQRLVRENLLKELAVRGVLPGHGFPTNVVPFVNVDRPSEDERSDDEGAGRSRRSFPTRNLDIAIRDYAPGSEVVVDGLVYRSAGVTLNWLRPADDAEAREVQSLKTFWSCGECGAADCAAVAPAHCPACHADIGLDRQRRFLEPAGFTADMRAKPHADTDEITYVEPEPERIVARGAAWVPFADPAQGRMRASADGMVFFSSRGPSKLGYHLCLECGRAAPAGVAGDAHPLAGHEPLRFTKKNAGGVCPGNDKPFKMTPPIALGHQAATDVAELQPVGLPEEGEAWAAVAAIREALARRLGVEAGELGLAVRPVRTALGQVTHSLYLFDRASGGAGFAPQAVTMWEALLADAEAILDCSQPGCVTGCSSCVLTADLHRQQEGIDRGAALAWARAARAALANVPEADRAVPGAALSRSAVDEIAAALDLGARAVTIWAQGALDVAELAAGPLPKLARRADERGARLHLVLEPAALEAVDPASGLALRDAARAAPFSIHSGTAAAHPNGARVLAAAGGAVWASRDPAAAAVGALWGRGEAAATVRFVGTAPEPAEAVDLDRFLPRAGARFLETSAELDGALAGFGARFVERLRPELEALGAWRPGELARLAYADRYLHSPLAVRLALDAAAALRDALAPGAELELAIETDRLRQNDRQPFAPTHNWQWADDREQVFADLAARRRLRLMLAQDGAPHGRTLTLGFADGGAVRVVLDQGFGAWETPRFARFDFGLSAEEQARKLNLFNAMVTARGRSYLVVAR